MEPRAQAIYALSKSSDYQNVCLEDRRLAQHNEACIDKSHRQYTYTTDMYHSVLLAVGPGKKETYISGHKASPHQIPRDGFRAFIAAKTTKNIRGRLSCISRLPLGVVKVARVCSNKPSEAGVAPHARYVRTIVWATEAFLVSPRSCEQGKDRLACLLGQLEA